MELARPALATDRQACTRLVSQALVAAATMRGGTTLVGEASPVTLLERWTEPQGAAHLVVGEYEGVVVGLAAVTAGPRAGGPERGLVECCYVESGARGVGVGTALMEAAVAWCAARGCAESTPWHSRGTARRSSAWRRPVSPPAC